MENIFDSDFEEEVFELDFNSIRREISSEDTSYDELNIENYNSDNESEKETELNASQRQDIWISDNKSDANDWMPLFNQKHGPKVDISNDPLSVFELFFSEDFLQKITLYTNIYAEMHDNNWKHIDVIELRQFIGIQIIMGIKRLDSERDHWCNDDILQTPAIIKVMTLQRYREIKKYLHFCDKTNCDKTDNLFKVRYLLETLPKISQKLYQPMKELSIDESLVGFRGRFKHIQYISSKSQKYGIKFYVMAESKTGYMLDWKYFSGSSLNSIGSYAERIVLDLVQSLGDNSGHELYTDNYYSSISLAEKLTKKGIGFTGTIRQNRKQMPFNFSKNVLKLSSKSKGPISMRRDKLLCIAWFDEKLVFGLSNHINSISVTTERRDKISTSGKTIIEIPKLFHQYNQFMGGVDLYDQKLHNHCYEHKCMKWPHVIWHLFRQVSLNNAYTVYKHVFPKKFADSKKFKLEIGRCLLNFSVISHVSQRVGLCSSAKIDWIDSNNKRKRKDCVVCKGRSQKRSRVTHCCSHCHLPLCANSDSNEMTCFQWHIKQQFK